VKTVKMRSPCKCISHFSYYYFHNAYKYRALPSCYRRSAAMVTCV